MKIKSVFGILVLFVATSWSFAGVTLPRVFSDNMVLQRGMEIPVWGWASGGEEIEVILNGHSVRSVAGEDGTWKANLPAMKAGGPHELVVKGNNELVLKNILIGDVWICSGQSNMQWPVSKVDDAEMEINNAKYPGIRMFSVPAKMSMFPENDLSGGEWVECSPVTVSSFSAVGYFFGREIHLEHDVPVGLIGTYWGGTEVEAWISIDALKTINDFNDEIKRLDSTGKSMEEIKTAQDELLQGWHEDIYAKDKGYQGNQAKWAMNVEAVDDWETMTLPGLWEDKGLDKLDGVVWFRKKVVLPASMASKQASIWLGPIDDSDETFVNGMKIGQTINSYAEFRRYTLPDGLLKEGENTVVVRVEDYRGGGGIYGLADDLKIVWQDQMVSLAGEWQYKIGLDKMPEFPEGLIIRNTPNDMVGCLYNAMIHPLVPYAIKGAVWYQGEANASRAYQYRYLFPMMIKDWRERWGQGDFPFLFVQLANFLAPDTVPKDDPWPELRETQTMTLSLPATGMASAIDIGEAWDIHPTNKQEVGRRLSLAANHVAYNEKGIVYSGPMFESFKVDGNKVEVSFNHVGSGLATSNKYGYLCGFALAGSDSVYHYAQAEIIGSNKVMVYSDQVKEPVAVRYAWANNPDQASLCNKEGLPANPFRTDKWPGVTFGKIGQE